jgi:hypothetical protein
MASELARTLAISGEEAADKLLNLSPYETKVPHTLVINVCNFQNSMLKVTWFLLCSFVFAEGFFVHVFSFFADYVFWLHFKIVLNSCRFLQVIVPTNSTRIINFFLYLYLEHLLFKNFNSKIFTLI